jgi:hypothetical protein
VKPTGSICAWHAAQAPFALCAAKRCRVVAFRSTGGGAIDCPEGGGGGGAHNKVPSTNAPRRTGDD